MFKQALVALSTVLVASSAAAHPGHGVPGQSGSLAHYLVEPIHVVGALAALLAAATAARLVWSARRAVLGRDEGEAS